MSNFDNLISELFGFSSHLDVSELRQLYYGRPNIYINFTNDASVDVEHDNLPESIVCYDIRDVVGNKIQSSKFYAHVFRINKNGKRFLDDVRRYKRSDFQNDMSLIRSFGWIETSQLDKIITSVTTSAYIRFEFEKMWKVTRRIAEYLAERGWREAWREILLSLGYAGFSDPSRTTMLGSREIRTVYIDYEGREDLDIVVIQKYRSDPRQRVSSEVEKYRQRMKGARNRVAKRRT